MMMSPAEFPDFFDLVSWKWLALLLVVCVARSWLKGQQFKERVSAKGLVALVTGTTGGIGKQIARELNLRGAKVHLFCRDKDKCAAMLDHMIAMGCNTTRLVLHNVDLTDLATVRKAVEEVKAAEEKLDVLILNAGVMLYPRFQLTKDGHELTWQSNFLAHFLITELCLPLLESAASGRVVAVSAAALFHSEPLELETLDSRAAWDQRQAYARSKMAQLMGVVELTRRLREKGSPVTANAVHPGLCRTSLARHTPLGSSALLKAMLAAPAWFLLKTPKDGAQTPLHLAISPSLSGVSGKLFAELQEMDFAQAAFAQGKGADPAALYHHSLHTLGLA